MPWARGRLSVISNALSISGSMDWVIDTDVLVRAEQGQAEHNHFLNIFQLLTGIRRLDDFLAVDHEGLIDREYRKNLPANGNIYRFLKDLAFRRRVLYLSGSLSQRISSGLRNLAFDVDDDVFVAVAHRTSSGRLVAEESDYSGAVIDFLSGYGVRVMDCNAAQSDIDRSSQ